MVHTRTTERHERRRAGAEDCARDTSKKKKSSSIISCSTYHVSLCTRQHRQMYYSTKEEKAAVTHFVASVAKALAQAVGTCANRHCEIIATSFLSLSPFSISLNSPQCHPASHLIIITTQEKLKKGGRGLWETYVKQIKKQEKDWRTKKDVTAEKNKLFFTICTLFAGNHTDKIIIIKVRRDWERLHRALATIFPTSNITSATSKLPSGTHGLSVRLFSLLSHIGVPLQSSSFFPPPSSLRSQVCGSHARRQQRALGCQQQRHATPQRGSTRKGNPLPVFGFLPVATSVPYAPLTHTPGWHDRRRGGARGHAAIKEGLVGQQGCNKKKKPNSPASHSFQSEPKNATRCELERCRISNTGLPLFFKTPLGNNMANSPPETFRPHPTSECTSVRGTRALALHRRALQALRTTALQRQCPTPTSAVARDMFTKHWAACISLSVIR